MNTAKRNIITELERQILPLQGFKPFVHNSMLDVGLGSITNAFPNQTFPLGAVHEFMCDREEEMAATIAFISGIASSLMRNEGIALWIGAGHTIFPPALKQFGLVPENIIFVDLKKEKEILWVMEEALKCNGLSAVICELKDLSFTASRRLQLAVEQTKVTGFILRRHTCNMNATTSLARWRIRSLSSVAIEELPGVGFSRWQVQLLKVRNGKPGSWQLEWVEGRFRHIEDIGVRVHELQRKIG